MNCMNNEYKDKTMAFYIQMVKDNIIILVKHIFLQSLLYISIYYGHKL